MSFSNKPPDLKYYYWWSNMCYTAFPESFFIIIIDGKEIRATGYSENYYLDHIHWDDKKVVGISSIHPWVLHKQYKDAQNLTGLLSDINI